MLRRLLQSLSVLLVILVTSSASAGTINVLGFVDFGPGEVPIATVNLGGDRGFTLNFSEQLSAHTAAANCVVVECPPDATISLNAGASPDLGGHAALNGVSYSLLTANCVPPDTCAFPRVQFTGQTVAPPFGDFTKAILTVPVEFSGFFVHTESFSENSGSEQLVASAIATLTLDKIDNTGIPGFPGPIWRYDGIRYELEP